MKNVRQMLGRTTAWLTLAAAWTIVSGSACSRSTIPSSLSDADFWGLIDRLSEPPGTFTLSDNLVSNEPHYAERIRTLRSTGGAYIGVGPEQNFSYIAALQPAMAFVIDIRRENRNLHLLYKALFELSNDRVEFVSRLFSRPRPAGLVGTASVASLFEQYESAAPSQELYAKTLQEIRTRLLVTRHLPLSATDLADIDRALGAFYRNGPEIHFWGSRTEDVTPISYRLLMTATDMYGRNRSYLADEAAFTTVKALHTRNMILPVIGDFGGSFAIRAVGDYLRQHGEEVEAFYASNVAVYLTNQQKGVFCGNLADLPAAPRAAYIENNSVRSLSSVLDACGRTAR
jgi:hypothetical protein